MDPNSLKYHIHSISPVDGRYYNTTCVMSPYFSEYGLIKYRLLIELNYFIKLCHLIPQLIELDIKKYEKQILDIFYNFNTYEAIKIKDIENKINHDVKAIEYYIKDKFIKIFDDIHNKNKYINFIHYDLTSQDINNTAIPLSIKNCLDDIFYDKINSISTQLLNLSKKWYNIPILSKTHGQPASPTRLGKEIMVFYERLSIQFNLLKKTEIYAKFGGAVGNLNAHYIAYPDINWNGFTIEFIESFGLKKSTYTTQIDHYDSLSTLFDTFKRINTILIDLNRDIWLYISNDYFKLNIIEDEVGSSTMPHKVNPINFENSESNLMLANSLLCFLSSKLPISRLQRDLTDSSVTRNIGVALSHCLIGYESLKKGLDKLEVNVDKIKEDLDNNWVIVSEGIVSVLKKYNYPEPYETLKNLTRSNKKIKEKDIYQFIESLNIDRIVKQKLHSITPFNYLGENINYL